MSDAALPSVPDVSGTQLSRKAIASAWEVWAKMRPLVVSAMVASALVGAAFAFLKTGLGISPKDAFPQGTLLELIKALMQSAIAVPLAVATHRLILKGETTPGIIGLRKSFHWIFLAWLCGLGIVPLLLMDLSLSAGSELLALALAIAALIVGINSVLLFPAVAIEAPSASWLDRFQAGWRQMRGHVWLFLRAILLAIIPLFIALLLLAGGVGIMALVLAELSVPEQALEPFMAAIFGALQPAGILIGAAVASWLYLYVQEKSAA